MQYSYKTKIILLSICSLLPFIFGTYMIYHHPDKVDLKILSGDLESYDMIRVPASRRMIDVLTFKISGFEDKIALYLGSKKNYEPLIKKLQTKKTITVLYDDKGEVDKDGYNLHIYQIAYGDETFISYESTIKTEKKVGYILFIVGFVFTLPIIYVYRQEKRKKTAGNTALANSGQT